MNIKNDYEFIKEIIKINEKIIIYVSNDIKTDNLKMFGLYKENREIIKFCRNRFIEDVNKLENGKYAIIYIYDYIDYIKDYNNYDKIIIYLYEREEYELIIYNKFILNYILDNIEKFENIIKYLMDIKNFKFIYSYEILNEFIKNKYKLLVMSLNDINIDNQYNNDIIKLTIEKDLKDFKIVWID
jgi:hypothetical protein